MNTLPNSTSYGYPTSRRYPRSLAEAYPFEHAAPVEHYPSRDRWLGVALAVVIGITLAASLVAWWSA